MTNEERKFLTEKRESLLRERDAEMEILRAKYDRKLNAYSVLLEEAEQLHVPGIPLFQDQAVEHPFRRPLIGNPKSAMDAIRWAIDENEMYNGKGAHFSTVTVEESISKNFPELAVKLENLSNLFWRMRKAGEIQIVKKGKGRTPAIYQKMNTPP